MKHCEVVRDIAFKLGEWLFHNQQFRFLRQSAPEQHPWDQIYWELWLRAMVNSRRKIPANQTHDNRSRSRSRTFPKCTCWTFHAGKTCSGCNYEHICYKCGAKHPASHCSASVNHTRHGVVSSILLSSPVMPIKVDRLEFLLQDYVSNLARYLVHGFRYGFHIQFIGNRAPFESPNLKSALQNPDLVMSKLQKEIDAGRIVGPLTKAPFPDFRSSPIGIVPKKTPNEVCLIQHLSYPSGFSVNDNIPEDCSTVHYATINQSVKIVQRLGVGCFMAKTDIKSAFRIIPIHPQDYSLLGLKWADKYHFDRCLLMGCSSAFSLQKLRASAALHILDDFLFVAPSAEKCEADLANFLHLCNYHGVPIAHEKTVQPRTTLEFAGITLDSISQDSRLPDKLQKCRTLLHQFRKRRTVTLWELQSLICLLNFACSVVVPVRAFLRRLIDLTKGIKK